MSRSSSFSTSSATSTSVLDQSGLAFPSFKESAIRTSFPSESGPGRDSDTPLVPSLLSVSLLYPDTAPRPAWRPQLDAWMKRNHPGELSRIMTAAARKPYMRPAALSRPRPISPPLISSLASPEDSHLLSPPATTMPALGPPALGLGHRRQGSGSGHASLASILSGHTSTSGSGSGSGLSAKPHVVLPPVVSPVHRPEQPQLGAGIGFDINYASGGSPAQPQPFSFPPPAHSNHPEHYEPTASGPSFIESRTTTTSPGSIPAPVQPLGHAASNAAQTPAPIGPQQAELRYPFSAARVSPSPESQTLPSPPASPLQVADTVKTCISCRCSQSPCWRPSWSVSAGQLCNSCGLRYKKTGARCLSAECCKIPSKGEWAVMLKNASQNSAGETVHSCLQCTGPVEVR